jgi:hypothetical protein
MSPRHFNPSKPVLQIRDARIISIKPRYNNIRLVTFWSAIIRMNHFPKILNRNSNQQLIIDGILQLFQKCIQSISLWLSSGPAH